FTSARVEINGRRLLRSSCSLERYLGLGAVEDLRADRVGEGADARVVATDRLVIVAARRVDAVLRPFQLILQRQEILVRLEIRISFERRQQPPERTAELALGILKRLNLRRIAEVAGIELDAGCLGAGLSHLRQHRALLRRITF